MDSQDSDPPSPLHSSPRSGPRGEHSRRTQRAPKDRDKTYLGSTSKELVRLLVHEEQESQELRSLLQSLTERLKDETQRADNAEQRAREVAMRFREANDGRLAAVHETARVSEELRLYKLQFDNAQREILRAQELLDSVEAQRHEAEEAAARARTTARKLKEEQIVQLAREQGRIEGLREGMERGRMLGYEAGRAEGYARARTSGVKDSGQSDVSPSAVTNTPPSIPLPPSPPSISPSRTKGSSLPPETETIRVLPPRESTTPPGTPPQQIRERNEVHPATVHNSARSPQQLPADYPPDSWIPVIDNDQRIRLPPPHELGPGPFSPRSSPTQNNRRHMPDISPEQPALMIPPPGDRQGGLSETDSVSAPTASRQMRPVRRRKSNDSSSTTLSQFDLIGPPVSGRSSQSGSRALSAIVEERSPSLSSTPYVPAPSATPVIPVAITLPTPQAPMPVPLDRVQIPTHDYYTRPGSRSSPESTSRDSSSQSQSRQNLSPRSSPLSNDSFKIIVEPPSRPESGRSGIAITQDGLLRASDAEHPPPPPAVQPPAPQPAAEQALPIFLQSSQLPPGFVPLQVPMRSPVQTQAAPVQPPDPHASDAPLQIPPPQGPQPGVPAIYRLYKPPTTSSTPSNPSPEPIVIPQSSSMGARRYSRSALDQGESSSGSDEDARAVSSNLSSSSTDTLSTPPERRRMIAASLYAAAPIPPNVIYPVPPPRSVTSHTSPAARVPLPQSSTTGSPHPSVATATAGAARVPLPQSSVGSPRSDYTRVSRWGPAGGADAETPGRSAQSPPLMIPGGMRM